MNLPTAHVLWFDDEWGTTREAGLGPWRRALNSLQPRTNLTQCSCLADFARYLQAEDPAAPRYSLLILDVMLIDESEANFNLLGFSEELVEPYDAGAQIAELMRSTRFDGTRPAWLRRYTDIPLLVLSSSPRVVQLVNKKVGRSRMNGLKNVSKSLKQGGAGAGIEASDEFLRAVNALLWP